jgi:hypothetical protein
MISCPNSYQTPNTGNQNVQRTPANQSVIQTPPNKKWYNYGWKATLLLRAPIHIHALPWHQQLIRHRHLAAMETLAQSKPDRTTLKEESINWLWKKLKMPKWMVHSSSTRILFQPLPDLLSFLLWESQGEIPFKGVVLSHQKMLNFGMWLKFTKF